MQPVVVSNLRDCRAQIRSHWEAFLRLEQVTTPLANPDVLAHLFDVTLDRVFAALERPTVKRRLPAFHCPCGQNPFLAYFRAAEQALLEALVLAQVQVRAMNPAERDRDLAELKSAIRAIGSDEITLFGSVCLHRQCEHECLRASPKTPHASTAG